MTLPNKLYFEGLSDLATPARRAYRKVGFRRPKKGEFYVSGAIPRAYVALADLTSSYLVVEPIEDAPAVVTSRDIAGVHWRGKPLADPTHAEMTDAMVYLIQELDRTVATKRRYRDALNSISLNGASSDVRDVARRALTGEKPE